MALSKSKKNLFLILKIEIIFIYILLDLVLWYFFIWNSIYNKSAFPFYGFKILFAIIGFILFLSFFNKLEKGKKIKLANLTMKTFSTLAVSGSLIEIAIFHFFNRETFIYTSLAAAFASLISSGAICSLYAMVFRFASNKSELEDNISAFYLPLIFKVIYTIYFFFSCVALGLIINYIRIRQESYLNIYKDETLNEILNINNGLNEYYENVFSDMGVLDRRIKNNLNQNILNIGALRYYLNENYRYIDLKNSYDSVYININGRFLESGYNSMLTVSRDAGGNLYSASISYGSPPVSLTNSDNFYSDVLTDNNGNILVSFYYPISLINNRMGNIIVNVEANEYFESISDNPSLSSWNYVSYKLSDKNVVYASDKRILNQPAYNSFNSEREFYRYISDFESRLENSSFYITPAFNMNNGVRTTAIFSYIKNLNVVSIYYKDVNSIIKNSFIEKNISYFMIFFGIIYGLLSIMYIRILGYTFVPIMRANESTEALREENRDLRKRIDCKNNDEIGLLVYNFNLFINDLELIIDNLKSKSENLTNDINNIEKIMEENSNSVNFQTESIKKSIGSIETIIDSIKNITGSTEQQREAFSSASLAVENLLQTVYRINENIERQFSSVEQTSASVEEMISNISSIAKNTSNADALFKKLLVEAGDGAQIVEDVIESIRNVESSNEQIKNIINIIQNIAEQTNLLAMNAAIEASHAGDAGRGFSVIADQIRSLAEHTTENSKSINSIIKGVTKRVEESVELANNSGKTLNNILSISENASRLVSEINIANSELEIGGKDILQTITKLNDTSLGVKDSVKEQITSGDAVDTQITLLDQINREVVSIVEAKSMDVNEVNDSISSLNSLSVQIIENRDKFYDMTNRLNNNFTVFNTLLMNFITNRDTEEEDEEETKNNLLKDDKFNIEREIEYQLKTLESELKISEEDDEEVLNTLKEDFKNPNMFY